ncbi:hypothetical protein [Stomatobaculum longum]|uniref:hypothetical protein n=1 Tax=Stomatobaculum longum TaxID=796942 RepID=UPI0028E398CF|nr:hypothetical protein [Stomatobaculum longum]
MSEQSHTARKKNIIQTTEADDSAAQKERIIVAAYSIGLEFSKQVQRLVMIDFPRALPTQALTWP